MVLGPLGCGILTGAGSVLIALGVTAGSSIAVFGAGGVGLDLAAELGATHTINGADPEIAAQIMSITGDGAQYSFDTTGVPSVISTAINSLRPTGTCGLVGITQGDLVLDPLALAGGRNLMGILEGDAVPQLLIPRLIDLWKQGRFPFDKLITTYPLSQINEAEAATTSGSVIKPILLPAGESRPCSMTDSEPCDRRRREPTDAGGQRTPTSNGGCSPRRPCGVRGDRLGRVHPLRRRPSRTCRQGHPLPPMAHQGSSPSGCLRAPGRTTGTRCGATRPARMPGQDGRTGRRHVRRPQSPGPPAHPDRSWAVPTTVRRDGAEDRLRRFSRSRFIIQAALDHGELSEGADPDLIVDAIMGGASGGSS
jgi:hypothetical protein